uniref:Uncharacterized protein n=1 Tax=Timema cristinae TaxID=61476 RepID=A0A7R9DNM0_TIMCR|nr:unnamed protein product [Timema cristinae]
MRGNKHLVTIVVCSGDRRTKGRSSRTASTVEGNTSGTITTFGGTMRGISTPTTRKATGGSRTQKEDCLRLGSDLYERERKSLPILPRKGLFADNRRFGPGVFTQPDGRQDVGLWRGPRLVRLSAVMDGVPRLGTSLEAKVKLLRYRTLVPIKEVRQS